MLSERGIEVETSRSTDACRPTRRSSSTPPDQARHSTGDRWFVDETYVKVSGRWTYLYRAIDQYGPIFDVMVSTRHNTARGA